MNRLLILIGIFLFFIGCQTRQKQNESNAERETDKTTKPSLLSTEEIQAGWQLLFDGETKKGWHIYNNQSEGIAWETRDGVLHLNPREIKVTPVPGAGDLTQAVGGGDLATNEDYDKFHLKLEWKVSSPSNSGIMLFVKEVPEHGYPWETGPEIQIMEQRECSDEINCVGDLYGLVAGPRDLEISKDWNTTEIIANNGTLEVIMNGRSLYTTTMWDDHWKSLIASTKFTAWPEFGTYKKGKIVLQDHGHAVWYRNIKIKRL
jgi:hypothetical protein